MHFTAAVPLAGKSPGVFVSQTEIFKSGLHGCGGASFHLRGSETASWKLALSSYLLPDQRDRFIDDFLRDVERRAETDRFLAGLQGKDAVIKQSFPKGIPCLGIGKVEREE